MTIEDFLKPFVNFLILLFALINLFGCKTSDSLVTINWGRSNGEE